MRRIESLEGLRGLLALWVVLGHVLALAGLGIGWRGPFKLLTDGGRAVDVFIILSGFVIFLLVDQQKEPYGHFIWRRFWRLFPVYAACCALMLVLLPIIVVGLQAWPIDHPLNTNRLRIMHDTQAHLWAHVIAHLPMLHAVVPPSVLPNSTYAILGQAWSISLEWQFYLLAPALYLAIKRGALNLIGAIGFAAAAHFLVAGWEGFLPRHVPYFAIGIASYFLWSSPVRPAIPDLPVIATALAYFASHDAALVVWAAVFSVIYAPSSRGASWVNGLLTTPVVRWLGRISYSVYLFHSIAMYAAMMIVARLISPSASTETFVLLFGLTLALTLIGSSILHRAVERPGIGLGAMGYRRRSGIPEASNSRR